MATIVFRGKAQINSGFGTATFDVIGYAEPQTFNISDEFQDDVKKDRQGNDCSRRGQNEKYKGDIEFELLGDTKANAAKINSVAVGGFLPMLSNVVISGSDIVIANRSWIVTTGQSISMKNDDVVKFKLPLEAYADATQNTLMTTIPS